MFVNWERSPSLYLWKLRCLDCVGVPLMKALIVESSNNRVLLLQMEVETDKIEQAQQTEAVPTPEVGMQKGAAAEDAAEGAQAQEGAGRPVGCLAGCLGNSATFGCV